jgi:hypothetical protein
MKDKTKKYLMLPLIAFCLFMIIWGIFEDKKVDIVTTIIVGQDTVIKGIRSDVKTIRIELDTVKYHLRHKN